MTSTTRPKGILRRALGNAGMMLTGKVATGVMQLATFAIAARGLGLNDFGYFSMLLAQVSLLTGLAAFQTNQAIIRYGVPHLEAGEKGAFQALVKAGTILDFGAALVAMVFAILFAPLIGDWLDWTPQLVADAQLIAPLALTTAIATPKSLLRLFGRFDLLTHQLLVTPSVRLVGVVIAWALGAGLTGYLIVWLVAGLVGAAVAIWFGWREAYRANMLHGLNRSFKGLTRENPGIWHFTLMTNISSSLGLIPRELSTVLVGAMLGPAAAGLFKVARELGTAFGRPVDLLNQSVFPDVARLVVSREWRRLRKTIRHAGFIASGTSGLITLILLIAGGPLIRLVFGEGYQGALPVLLLIALATTISVWTVAADAALYALGRPTAPLAIALAANLVFATLLVWRLPIDGIHGAGVAFLASSITNVLMSLGFLAAMLRRAEASSV